MGAAEPGDAASDGPARDARPPPGPRRLAAAGHARAAHAAAAPDAPLTYLAYGTRDPNDVCYYPRSNKVFLRGVGLIARLEPLEYSDGEPG